MLVPHPPGQSIFPVAEPLNNTCVQVRSVDGTVEDKAMFNAEPLQIVVAPVAFAVGVAPTVSVTVKAFPVHPNADVGMIE